MRPRLVPAFLLGLALLSPCGFSDDQAKQPPMSQQTRLALVRAFTSELVYAHTTFPIGKKGLTLKNGQVTPAGKDLEPHTLRRKWRVDQEEEVVPAYTGWHEQQHHGNS